MNLRPHPGLTIALATALVGTAPMPAVADDTDEPPMVQHCYIQAITDEEVAAGAVSEIDCYEVPAGTPMELPSARGTVTYAIVYDISDTVGDAAAISGPSCTGGNAVFAAGSTWDNRISATELRACGSAKHWSSSTFTGSNQMVTGVPFSYHAMNATMNNVTSSIAYAP